MWRVKRLIRWSHGVQGKVDRKCVRKHLVTRVGWFCIWHHLLKTLHSKQSSPPSLRLTKTVCLPRPTTAFTLTGKNLLNSCYSTSIGRKTAIWLCHAQQDKHSFKDLLSCLTETSSQKCVLQCKLKFSSLSSQGDLTSDPKISKAISRSQQQVHSRWFQHVNH